MGYYRGYQRGILGVWTIAHMVPLGYLIICSGAWLYDCVSPVFFRHAPAQKEPEQTYRPLK